MERKYHDRAWIKEKLDSGIGVAEIARRADCSRYNIYKYLHKFSLELPSGVALDPEWLKTKVEEGLSMRQIAKEVGCSGTTIASNLDYYGIDKPVR